MISQEQIQFEFFQYTHGISRSRLKQWKYSVLVWSTNSSWLSHWNIHILHSKSTFRHFKLRRLIQSPYIITAIGDLGVLDKPLLWIVGPRKPSMYATDVLKDLFTYIQWYDIATISWWALWIDSLCHNESIAKEIPTVMVLGEWLRHAMSTHKSAEIQRVIDAWWLVLSEFPPDMQPNRWSFPQRNRIIAWMSEMVFVPAAGKWSWSLISVDYALQMQVPVYSVPWSIYDPTSAWTNQYACEKKILATTDFSLMLQQFFWKKIEEQQPYSYLKPQAQQALLKLLPLHKDVLLQKWCTLADISLWEIQWVLCIDKHGIVTKK